MLLVLTGLAQGDVPVPMVAAAVARQHLLHQGQELQPPVLPEDLLQEQRELMLSEGPALLTHALGPAPTPNSPRGQTLKGHLASLEGDALDC